MIEWSENQIHAFRKTLLDWYDVNGRQLPWRQDHEPYHVWISEIMLQQTQVNTVIPYYQRFMTEFPTVSDLAAAPEAKLMKAWEGLGYYSRARNLQKAAKQIVNERGGQWPKTVEGLQELAGIGPYTAGAIASIAFNEPVPAVDGNAFRVFARLLEIDLDIAKPQARPIFEKIIERIMSPDRPGDFNQAIMDLGSSYMTAKNPDSAHSPVKAFNQAYIDGVEMQYPVKSKKPKPVKVSYYGIVIRQNDQFLMQKRPSEGLLANFWTFPLIAEDDVLALSKTPELVTDEERLNLLEQLIRQEYGLHLRLVPMGAKPVKHTFTHRQWIISLLSAEVAPDADLSFFPGKWLSTQELNTIALPKVQEKLMQRLVNTK
ncbi:A/G-specific adenine glycosylase [Lactobacillus sp. LC28-10]|uniref:Adenine DNA glycosylase n=1 Tax=Secundilactobacillus angelensis TaxID=2722706 RepID=A0ABX1KY68_9LACO|nr:A/G-specific adenine glycosylase [Secundilactobacillus angelensis]MCH5462428.1 A/G-specific adenine glycosylase [Secundilactobacillus angelensis]NLR18090.1 A/G-specific adenine glycosylase [Secundilactobacillus angelensis]